MALFTIVNDGYDVDVYRSAKSVVDFIVSNRLSLDEDCEQPATTRAAREAVKKNEYVLYLYEEGFRGWKYRIEKQSRTY
jgi:hypothetical protein